MAFAILFPLLFSLVTLALFFFLPFPLSLALLILFSSRKARHLRCTQGGCLSTPLVPFLSSKAGFFPLSPDAPYSLSLTAHTTRSCMVLPQPAALALPGAVSWSTDDCTGPRTRNMHSSCTSDCSPWAQPPRHARLRRLRGQRCYGRYVRSQ